MASNRDETNNVLGNDHNSAKNSTNENESYDADHDEYNSIRGGEIPAMNHDEQNCSKRDLSAHINTSSTNSTKFYRDAHCRSVIIFITL